MKWTRDRPTEPGIYLRWLTQEEEPDMIEIVERGGKLCSAWTGAPISYYQANGWWLRIERPEGKTCNQST